MNEKKIEIFELENGFSVKFPFELKDAFRAIFKNATWNSFAKRWEVGPRSGKKLKEWSATIEQSGVLNSLQMAAENNESEQITERERENLINEMEKIKNRIEHEIREREQREKALQSLQKIREEIEANRELLVAAEDETALLKKNMDDEKKRIRNLLGGIIDWSVVHKNKELMAKHLKLRNRENFNVAQREICKQRKFLRQAGWECAAIEFLSDCNFNQPHRDNPELITEDKWYKITRIVDNEEDEQ